MKTILANLIYELTKHGFIHIAEEISDILFEFMEENYTDDNEDKIPSIDSVVNIVGLRGDTVPEQPTGGFTVNPFFMDTGDPF